MNMPKQRRFGIIAVAGLAFALTTPALAYTGQKFRSDAKVGMKEARAIALKAHPGTVTDAELEREPGGSGLRYSFDIRSGRHVQEVGIDASTGTVLENDREGPNPD